MKVFVINLARSTGRRRAIGTDLSRMAIEHEFFRAIDASAGEHRGFSNFTGERPGRNGKPLTAGENGCFASHYLLWQRTLELNEKIVVLEDDAALHPGFADAVNAAEATLDAWPYVRLCGLLHRPFVELGEAGGFTLVRYRRGPSGGQAYALSPEGARRLVANAERWEEPLDDYLDRFWFHGVPCVGLLPYRVTLAPTHSDIGERPGYTRLQKLRRKMFHLPDAVRRTVWNIRHD